MNQQNKIKLMSVVKKKKSKVRERVNKKNQEYFFSFEGKKQVVFKVKELFDLLSISCQFMLK